MDYIVLLMLSVKKLCLVDVVQCLPRKVVRDGSFVLLSLVYQLGCNPSS